VTQIPELQQAFAEPAESSAPAPTWKCVTISVESFAPETAARERSGVYTEPASAPEALAEARGVTFAGWVAIGVAIGAALGAATGQLPSWVATGAALGAALRALVGRRQTPD
jgi:hypothetical protein